MGSVDQDRAGFVNGGWRWVVKMMEKVVEVAKKAKKLGEDDPRRITHSLKAGLAVSLVTLLYYLKPIYGGFGTSTMWAVLTVVVVFEFSVGATLGRGLNRGLATLTAGALGVGAHYLANLPGKTGQPILLGLFVFILAAVVSFIRFFPRMKARYDYGLLIFILTFCLVSVSGYQDEEVLDLAHKRLTTILIGTATAVFVSIGICPVWAGDDLHNLVLGNLDNLANFLQGFAEEYSRVVLLEDEEYSKDINQKLFQGYKSILTSKGSEDSLTNFAKWEPRHGRFRYRHPWKHYQKVGSLTRQCAYHIEAFSCYPCTTLNIQAPKGIQCQIQEACKKMSRELGKALKDLASAIKTMTKPPAVNPHIMNAKTAAKTLKLLLKTTSSQKDFILFEVIPSAIVAVQLIEVISCVEKIAESVHELASLAHFKDPSEQKVDMEGPPHHHIISINNGSSAVLPSIEESGNLVHVTNTDVNLKGSKLSKTNVRQMRQFFSF